MKEVYSSAVAAIGYDEATRELHVQWARGGRTSVYYDVPPEVAERVANAPSIGSALRQGIQEAYKHGYLL